jgi:glycosyltransferase involved in cell wall biosynthesis
MKVLLSVCACIPGRGSEPGIGWNWVQQIAAFNEAWVLTRAKHRVAIEAALAKQALPNAHFVYFDLPAWAGAWQNGERFLRLYYLLWQLKAYFVARKLHRQVGFDLVHHVTWGNYWIPTFLAFLPIPFVWGPIGGAESAPSAFRGCFGWRAELVEFVRDVGRRCGELNPVVPYTARRAALTLASTDCTQARISSLGGANVEVFSSAGLPADELDALANIAPRNHSPFRMLSIGRLLHWKGFEFGLRAFAQLLQKFPDSEYWLVGDGPARKRLEELTLELGISENVKFWGALPRLRVLEKLGHSDLLVFPSLHDSGGWVSLEAMAAGRPVICLELGGPALQVTGETGIKVPAVSPSQVVSDLADAMALLATNVDYRLRLGRAARAHVKAQFSWDRKGSDMAKIYSRFDSGDSKPVGVGSTVQRTHA